VRSIWKGAASCALVSIGVKLDSATEDHDIRFHQVHKTDGGRVKYKRVCSVDGEEVEYNDIGKGYELPDGQLVVLTDEDFDQLPLGTTHEIEVLQFVDQEQIDPIHFEKTYYLAPDGVPPPRVRAAAHRAGERRPGRDHQDRDPAARVAGRAAGARGRPGAAHDAVARRDPSSRLHLPPRGRAGPAAGAGDGRVADLHDGRRLRPLGVHRRLPRGHAAAAGGQAVRR